MTPKQQLDAIKDARATLDARLADGAAYDDADVQEIQGLLDALLDAEGPDILEQYQTVFNSINKNVE